MACVASAEIVAFVSPTFVMPNVNVGNRNKINSKITILCTYIFTFLSCQQDALEEMRLRNSGFIARLSSACTSPTYTLSMRLLTGTARMLYKLCPSESTVKAVVNLTPDLAACPFAQPLGATS